MMHADEIEFICREFVNLPAASPPCRSILGLLVDHACSAHVSAPQATFPLCTLAETPRSSAHCVEWARLIAWEAERGGTDFDADVVSIFFFFECFLLTFFALVQSSLLFSLSFPPLN